MQDVELDPKVTGFAERMCEVYGRGGSAEPTGTRLWWLGYAEKKPDAAWCKEHVSEITGSFEGVIWSDEHKGWIITFGPPVGGYPALQPVNAPETTPGTFTGTSGIEW